MANDFSGDSDVVDGNVDSILVDTGIALPAQIGALNDVSSSDVQTAAAAALTAYDPPTNTEMEARTLPSADYFNPSTDEVGADIKKVNGYTVDGAGTEGDPWGPA